MHSSSARSELYAALLDFDEAGVVRLLEEQRERACPRRGWAEPHRPSASCRTAPR